jgi:hypothetical protein
LKDLVLRKDSRLVVQTVLEMAETGAGSDACLEAGCLPMRVHFYSPVPDIQDLERRNVWERRSDLTGIDFRRDEQVALLLDLGREFGDECRWPREAPPDSLQFYTGNNSFSFGCAASLHCLIRRFKPKRIIEIGSGHSSLVISAALRCNAREDSSSRTEYTIIDPYPGPTVQAGLPGMSRLMAERVERIEPALFEALGENDLLFIDSGHTVRTGSDVNFLILDILPRLAPGVIAHFHDIGLPYEYPKVYFTNPAFRMFWTEAYLLQAFLACNAEFEILLALGYLMTDRMEEFRRALPHFDPAVDLAISGSFWIRRKRSQAAEAREG